jgi:L-fuculose-phosphate aldolase
MSPSETELREQLCLIGTLLHEQRLVDGASGNLSARLDAEHILCTPSGIAKGFMTADDLIVVNMAGERVDAPNPVNIKHRPTSEMAMHLAGYRARASINGVIHAHPPISVALTLADLDLNAAGLPEVMIALGHVPTLPYSPPGDAAGTAALEAAMQNHDAVLLRHHGSLTAGRSAWEAFLKLESLEHAAYIYSMAQTLGGIRAHLPYSVRADIQAIRARIEKRKSSADD